MWMQIMIFRKFQLLCQGEALALEASAVGVGTLRKPKKRPVWGRFGSQTGSVAGLYFFFFGGGGGRVVYISFVKELEQVLQCEP